MFKVAATNQPVDMGKSLNLLDLQLYSRSKQEKHAPILAWNLAEGNQWLKECAPENDTTRQHNFFPPENSLHKFIDQKKKRIQCNKIIQTNIIQAKKIKYEETIRRHWGRKCKKV